MRIPLSGGRLTAGAALLLSALALACRPAAGVEVTAWDHGPFGRLVFNWPAPTGWSISGEGTIWRLAFDRPVDKPMEEAVWRLERYLDGAAVEEGGRAVSLLLSRPLEVEAFSNGPAAVVIDFRPEGQAAAPVEAAPAAAQVEAPPAPAPVEVAQAGGDGPVIVVRGGEHPDFSRIVFDWTAPVDYTVDRQGASVTVAFAAPASVDLARARPEDLSRVEGIAQESRQGPLEVLLTVPPNARIRHFYSGTKVVIDVLDGTGPAPEEVQQAAVEAPPPPPEAVPPPDAAPAPLETARTEPADEALPEPAAPPVAAAEVPAEARPEPEPAAPAAEPLPELSAAEPPPAVELEPVAPAEAPMLVAPAVEPTDATAHLVLDPGTPSLMAVFERFGSLWVVLAAERRPDAGALAAAASDSMLGTPRVIEAHGGIALRFPMPEVAPVGVSREGTAWTLTLGDEAPGQALEVEPEPDFALGPRVHVPLTVQPGLVSLIDPDARDQLIVAATAEPGRGIPDARRFVQFRILPSAQGVVVQPLSDGLSVRAVGSGLEIVDRDGLVLSAAADRGAGVPAVAAERLFDATAWRGEEGAFTASRQALERTVALAEAADRPKARLDLARFFFANGYAQEALGNLGLLAGEEPGVAGRPEFAALRGAVRALAYDPEGALADLSLPAFAQEPEAALWRGLAAAGLGDWPAAEAGFAAGEAFIAGYPSPLRERLGLAAGEAALRQGDPDTAERRLAALSVATAGASEGWPAATWLRGAIARTRGDAAGAGALWREVASGEDRLWRAVAELDLVGLELEEGSITWGTAAERLEAMRFAWRGDERELDLLRRLGEVYWRGGRQREALDTWRAAAKAFAGEPGAEAIEDLARGRFASLFEEGGDAAALAPLAAVALFEDYRDLMPEGEAGDRLLLGLAGRLAEIDLLDRAADLIEEQAGRQEGAPRAALGARLAGIRLIDGQPEAALDAIETTSARGLTEDLARERRLLKARALSELGRKEDAIAQLAGDASRLADAARLDIAWRAEDWPAAAEALEQLVGDPPPLGGAIDAEQAELVLNLGVALALADDRTGLDRLALAFGPSMAATPEAGTFALLTRPDAPDPGAADLDSVMSQVAEVGLFEDFLDAYRGASPTGGDGPG